MIYTLLECTQLLLSALDSDEVNSINDTTESKQVALLLKGVFYDSCTDLELPQQEGLIELLASGSALQPVLMKVPSSVARLHCLKYDVGVSKSDMKELHYVPFETFLESQNAISEQSSTAQMSFVSNGDTFTMHYHTDRAPSCYTTIDHNTVLFDAVDLSVDTTLQKSKTQCFAWSFPVWVSSDSFVPPLEPQQFSYFLNKAKTRAFKELKQTDNTESAMEARKQRRGLQKRKRTVMGLAPIYSTPRYGRK